MSECALFSGQGDLTVTGTHMSITFKFETGMFVVFDGMLLVCCWYVCGMFVVCCWYVVGMLCKS